MKQVSQWKRMGVLRPPMPWHKPRVRESGDEVVVLLHGLWRSMWAMDPMAKWLHQSGYTTVNFPYGSFTRDVEELVDRVEMTVSELADSGRRVNVVTHSLGGVLIREVLHRWSSEQLGRVVMLAPPHGGSEIVDWLEGSPVQRVLGPAGKFLSTRNMTENKLGWPEHIETAVVMGKKSLIPFFRGMLDEDNDGIVSVDKGRLAGVNEFSVVDADHTFISSEPEVMQMALRFLKEGKLHA